VELRILGPLEVIEEGHSLALAAGKQRALFAILLLHANEVVSRDRLIDELWGERTPASAAKSVQIYVSQLRKALGAADTRLLTRPNGYELLVEDRELDLDRFQDLVDEAREAPPGDAATKFRAALDLWRGPPLADFRYEPFAQGEIARLEELRLVVVEERIEADLALGRHSDLVGELDALVTAHPFRERLRGLLMLALYRSGRQAEALLVYQQTRDVLVSELGLEPSRELQELEQAILRQDAALDLTPSTAGPRATVTMLFTDIEGSTVLVRQLGDRYEHVLNTHRRLLRNAFNDAGGKEIDRQGDALFFVFPSAKNAVLAAAAAQSALAQESWPDGTDVRVRIGIHTGEPGMGEEGYHGLGVVRAARISAAGHGGQVLLSEATTALIEDEELQDLQVRDLGEHQLKDMPRPERIFQLVGPGLVEEFPALRAPSETPLPIAGTEEQLAEAARAAAVSAPPSGFRGRVSSRPSLLVAAGAALLAAAIASAFLFNRGSGSDGITRVAPNSVGAIDLKSNKIVAKIPVGTRPGPIVYADGQLWVANLGNEVVSKIDPKAQALSDIVSLGSQPNALGVHADAIWAATGNGIKSIDSAFDSVRSIKVEPVKPRGELFTIPPTAVAFTRHAAWVVIGAHVTKADPRTGRVLERIATGTAPAAIASGGSNVWIADSFDNTLTRVAETGAITATTEVGQAPSAIAVGSDAVWVADADDDNVKRVDPRTGSVVTTIDVGRHPSGIALSPGAVWVANQYDDSIWRIDPSSNTVVDRINVGGSPVGLAVAGGALWFTVQVANPAGISALGAEGGAAYVDVGDGATDPAEENSFTVQGLQLEFATCAKLLNYQDKPGPAGAQLEPELARAMPIVSSDGRTYTFTIRRGYRFSPPSVEQVTPKSMKYTIERSLAPRTNFLAYQYVGDIVGDAAYRKRKTRSITGIIAGAKTLTIKLVRPSGDFLSRISLPFFCAVPMETPPRRTEKPIPSAGPYYVASHVGEQVVLKQNPNYHGPRPHRFRKIVYTGVVGVLRTIERVASGQSDYVPVAGSNTSSVPIEKLNARYGSQSPAAQRGHQQLFINPGFEADAIVLNTSRPLFATSALRRAVSYAISRAALARLGGLIYGTGPLTARVTDQYLTPGLPGFKDRSFYPLQGDLQKARRLAGRAARQAMLYTCNEAPCPQEAQIVKEDLAKIGIDVEVRAFPLATLETYRQRKPGEPWDIGLTTWLFDFPDPFDVLNLQFDGDLADRPEAGNAAHFDDPTYNRRLQEAARLSGARRSRAYERLDADLVRHASPFVAFANETKIDFFSRRIGCQLYQPVYGMDLADLCIRPANS